MRDTFAIGFVALVLGGACASQSSSIPATHASFAAALAPAEESATIEPGYTPEPTRAAAAPKPTTELAATETVPIPMRGPENIDHLSAPPHQPSEAAAGEEEDEDAAAAPASLRSKTRGAVSAR